MCGGAGAEVRAGWVMNPMQARVISSPSLLDDARGDKVPFPRHSSGDKGGVQGEFQRAERRESHGFGVIGGVDRPADLEKQPRQGCARAEGVGGPGVGELGWGWVGLGGATRS